MTNAEPTTIMVIVLIATKDITLKMVLACILHRIKILLLTLAAKFGIGLIISALHALLIGISQTDYVLKFHLNAKPMILPLEYAFLAMEDMISLTAHACSLPQIMLLQLMLVARPGPMEFVKNAQHIFHSTRMEFAQPFQINARLTLVSAAPAAIMDILL